MLICIFNEQPFRARLIIKVGHSNSSHVQSRSNIARLKSSLAPNWFRYRIELNRALTRLKLKLMIGSFTCFSRLGCASPDHEIGMPTTFILPCPTDPLIILTSHRWIFMYRLPTMKLWPPCMTWPWRIIHLPRNYGYHALNLKFRYKKFRYIISIGRPSPLICKW